jgi:hypothetical protein
MAQTIDLQFVVDGDDNLAVRFCYSKCTDMIQL